MLFYFHSHLYYELFGQYYVSLDCVNLLLVAAYLCFLLQKTLVLHFAYLQIYSLVLLQLKTAVLGPTCWPYLYQNTPLVSEGLVPPPYEKMRSN